MKLLSYHIENYGKIHNTDGTFDGNLSVFCERNGFGKTTLASFIKAMFYGLPSYTAKTKTFDDRQHFYPFNGGKFGGNITFEMQGKTYKIERFFDKKSGKDDEMKIYCNGAPYNGFGEDVGKEIFGLDEEAFKKTVFITADEIEISSTHSINEKLNRSVEGTGEDNYEDALAVLEKAKKELKAARGNNDRISEKKAEIAELIARIKNLQELSKGLGEEYKTREDLSREIAAMEQSLKALTERNLVLQKWENYDNLAAQAEKKAEMLARYRAQYPQGLPNEEERKALSGYIREEAVLQGALQTETFGGAKEENLLALQRKFEQGTPTETEFAQTQQNIQKAASLQAEIERLEKTEKTDKEKLLESKFSLKVPQDKELDEQRALLEEYKRKDTQLKELHASLLNVTPKQITNTKKMALIGLPLAVLLLLGGGLLAILVHVALGIAVMLLGAITALATVFLSGKKSFNATLPPSNVNVTITALQADLHVLEEKMKAFTIPYGYYSGAGVAHDLFTLEEDVKAYKAYLQSEESRKEKLQQLTVEMEEIQGKTRDFLCGYGEDGADLQNGLTRLTTAAASYASLQADKQAAGDSEKQTRERLQANQQAIKEVLEKYDLSAFEATMSALNRLEMDNKAIVDLEKETARLQETLSVYKEKNGLTERPAEGAADTDGLHADLSSARKQLADCDKRIAEIERMVEKLPDEESTLERAEETLKAYVEKHALLADTIAMLQTAEQSLKDRYVAPIKEKFSRYAEALERVLDEKVSMDQDFRVVFERGGEARSDRHLSAGERSLCALCLRLALVDNMYETEQPFIVMDDPFVHLDDEHMGRTAALLKELSKDRQIIYFCCHDSRNVIL